MYVIHISDVQVFCLDDYHVQNDVPRPEVRERKSLAIVALLDSDNENVRELWVMPHMKYSAHQLQVREGSDWFSEGERVGNLDQLLDAVNRVQMKRRSRAS